MVETITPAVSPALAHIIERGLVNLDGLPSTHARPDVADQDRSTVQ